MLKSPKDCARLHTVGRSRNLITPFLPGSGVQTALYLVTPWLLCTYMYGPSTTLQSKLSK